MSSNQRGLKISEGRHISHWVKLLEPADAVIVVFVLSCWRCFKKQPAFRTSEHKSKRNWNWSTRQRLKSSTPTQVWMEQILSRSSTVQLAASATPVTPVQPAQGVQRTMAQWFNSNRKLMKDCTSTRDQCGYNIALTLEPHKLWMVQCITKKCKDSLAYLLARSGCRSRRFSIYHSIFLGTGQTLMRRSRHFARYPCTDLPFYTVCHCCVFSRQIIMLFCVRSN